MKLKIMFLLLISFLLTGCEMLSTLELSQSTESNLTQTTQSNSTQSTDYDNTYDGFDFYPLNDKECAVSLKKSRFLKEVVIPSKYKNYTVTTIYSEGVPAFTESIVIPNTVTVIGERAFEEYINLKSIVIPKSVETIDMCAFSLCTSLSKIEFEAGSRLKTIKDNAFLLCTSLKNITIPSNVETIEGCAFNSCYSLETINIPSSIVEMGEEIFIGCDKVTIYCAFTSKPSTWPSNWTSEKTVYWGK